MASQFTNPFTNPGGFFSTQPGGFFAAPQGGNTLTGLISDPRVNIGLAIAGGQPLGKAIMGGALQAQQVRAALTPEDKERKIVKGADGRQRYVDTGELVFPDVEPTPAKLSEREIRIDDLMTTFNIDRADALKYDKGLIELSKDAKGDPILLDKVTGTSKPVGQTISESLNASTAISSDGENLIKNQTPDFMVKAPLAVEKAYSSTNKDDAIALSGSVEDALDSAAQLASIIQQKPELAGIIGTVARTGKSLFGTIKDLQSGIGVNLLPPQVLNQFQDPNISRIAILEEEIVNAMADTAYAKGNRTPTNQLKQQMRDKLNLTGFTDSASAITRLNEIAKEFNKDAQNYHAIKGGYNEEFGDRVKDYSLDPAYNVLFQPTRVRLNASDYTD